MRYQRVKVTWFKTLTLCTDQESGARAPRAFSSKRFFGGRGELWVVSSGASVVDYRYGRRTDSRRFPSH